MRLLEGTRCGGEDVTLMLLQCYSRVAQGIFLLHYGVYPWNECLVFQRNWYGLFTRPDCAYICDLIMESKHLS